MNDFSHLDKLNVSKETTATYILYQISGEPELTVSTSTQANKPYFNAVLRRSGSKAGKRHKPNIEQARAEDRDLFPRYVIKGWKGIKDAKGKAVKFSESNCSDFVAALPDWIFDEIRVFCGNVQNFVDTPDDDDIEAKAKK